MTFGTVRYILPGQDLCLHSIHIFGTYGACVQARMDLELLRDVIVVGPVQGKKVVCFQKSLHSIGKGIGIKNGLNLRKHGLYGCMPVFELFFYHTISNSLLHAKRLWIYLNNNSQNPHYKADFCTPTTKTALWLHKHSYPDWLLNNSQKHRRTFHCFLFCKCYSRTDFTIECISLYLFRVCLSKVLSFMQQCILMHWKCYEAFAISSHMNTKTQSCQYLSSLL